MSEPTRRPGYLTFSEYWATAAELQWDSAWGREPSKRPNQTWASALYGSYYEAPFPKRIVMSWERLFESAASFDMFVYEFLLSKTAVGNIHPGVTLRALALSGNLSRLLRRNRSAALRTRDSVLDLHSGLYSVADVDLLHLFELCFPESIYGLHTWLKADSRCDLFHVAELLRAGISVDCIPDMLDNGIDAELAAALEVSA
jgi:hypothetical protein